MAVVQYTGIVNQIRGKLNGSVFNKARNVNTLQRKQQSPRRNVGFQSEVRGIFSAAQRSWKTLTTSQHQQWATAAVNNPSRDRFGNLVPLSGYNQYIKAFMFATYANTTPLTAPDTSPAPDPGVTNVSIGNFFYQYAPDGSVQVGYDESITFDYDDPGFAFIFDVSMAMSRGTTAYYGRFTAIDGAIGTGGVSLIGLTNIGSRY